MTARVCVLRMQVQHILHIFCTEHGNGSLHDDAGIECGEFHIRCMSSIRARIRSNSVRLTANICVQGWDMCAQQPRVFMLIVRGVYLTEIDIN